MTFKTRRQFETLARAAERTGLSPDPPMTFSMLVP